MTDTISILKSKNPDLKKAEISGILYIIYSKEKLTNSHLVQATGLPKRVLAEFKSSISQLLKTSKSEEIVLNEKGQDVLSKMDLRPYKWRLLEPDVEKFAPRIEKIRHKYNLKPKRDYDQFFATPASTVGKATMLVDKGLVDGYNIALLGDDDLVSLALALISPEFKKVHVFDIDERILDIIEKEAKDLGMFSIRTEQYDVRQPLPETEIAQYDAVLIDPPYTRAGVQLFLHRSIELLKKNKSFASSYILFNFGAGLRNPELESKVQEVINNFGLVIEDKINKFTRYHGAETIGSASSLYVLKTTPFTSVENSVLPDEIYTFEKTEVEKFPFVDHYTFKLNQVPRQIVGSKSKLQQVLGEFCRIHKLNVVDTNETKFKGGGYSFTYVLATSNLLAHTWPEREAVHIDLVTCSPVQDKEGLGSTLSGLFKTKYIEIRRVE